MDKQRLDAYFYTRHASKTEANSSKRGIETVFNGAIRDLKKIRLVVHSSLEFITRKYKHAPYAVFDASAKPCNWTSNTLPFPIIDRLVSTYLNVLNFDDYFAIRVLYQMVMLRPTLTSLAIAFA